MRFSNQTKRIMQVLNKCDFSPNIFSSSFLFSCLRLTCQQFSYFLSFFCQSKECFQTVIVIFFYILSLSYIILPVYCEEILIVDSHYDDDNSTEIHFGIDKNSTLTIPINIRLSNQNLNGSLLNTSFVSSKNQNRKSLFNFTLLHNNDFHTRFIPINAQNNAQCSLQTTFHKDCVGGTPRTVALVKEYRKKYNDRFLFLNAGDHFQGTFWYTLNRSEIVAHFVAQMEQDEMALGNHEFDDGEVELKKFITTMEQYKPNFQFLCANILLKPDSVLNGKIKASSIRIIQGRRIAIIGYVTPETSFLANPGKKVQFTDEIIAIRAEIEKIKKQDSSINIFIAVGHSGLKKDLDLAYSLPELDLVVGGHSHTFLWSNKIDKPNLNDIPVREYPIVIRNNGSTTLVVQAFAFGKYMGHLDLSFDDDGKIQKYSGHPIYMNGKEDPNALIFLEKSLAQISQKINETVGETKVELNNQYCRLRECEIGNLVADSIQAHYNYSKASWQQLKSECDSVFAIFNGGSIRSSISKGLIAQKDVLDALPYPNPIGLTLVTPHQLWTIFEHSAQQFNLGGFLQISKNLRAKYRYGWDADTAKLEDVELYCNKQWKSLNNIMKKENKKIASIERKNRFFRPNDVPTGGSINIKYVLATSSYIFQGGDNYQMFNQSIWNSSNESPRTALISYLNNSTVSPIFEDRIIFVTKSDLNSIGTLFKQTQHQFVHLFVLFFIICQFSSLI